MKTLLCALLVITQLLGSFAFSLPVSIAEESLPKEVSNDIMGTELLCSAHAAMTSNDYWFVLVRTEDEKNLLKCYKWQEGRFSFLFETESAIPQGTNEVVLEYVVGMEDFTTHTIQDTPLLTISQKDSENEYIEFFTAYQYEAEDTWSLVRLWNYSEYGNAIFGNESIQLYEDIEADQIAITDHTKVERYLRNLSLSELLESIDTIVNNRKETDDEYAAHGGRRTSIPVFCNLFCS